MELFWESAPWYLAMGILFTLVMWRGLWDEAKSFKRRRLVFSLFLLMCVLLLPLAQFVGLLLFHFIGRPSHFRQVPPK